MATSAISGGIREALRVNHGHGQGHDATWLAASAVECIHTSYDSLIDGLIQLTVADIRDSDLNRKTPIFIGQREIR